MNRRYEIINRIIEAEIYLYIFLMFLTKAEGIRNILAFSSFGLWLLTLQYRDIGLLRKSPVSRFFWIYIGTTVISTVFSIDPSLSIHELRDDPLKSAVLFPVIATVMSDGQRLKKAAYTSFLTALLITSLGYYSYIVHGTLMLKPAVPLMNVWHNKFPVYLNSLLPFAIILFFQKDKPLLKTALVVSFLAFIVALVLNTTRAGYVAFLAIAVIWAYYLSRQNIFPLRKSIVVVISAVVIAGTFSYYHSDFLRKKIRHSRKDIPTFNERTTVWEASYHAIKQKPLLGWGYGKEIFHKNEVFANTVVKKRPHLKGKKSEAFDDPHNTFLSILFHQGVVGLVPYILLIGSSILAFWKGAFRSGGTKGHILMACASVLLGNYVLNSLVAVLQLKHLAVVLGLGLAAQGLHEDSGP